MSITPKTKRRNLIAPAEPKTQRLLNRRKVLTGMAAGAVTLSMGPAFLRRASAATGPIKIGMPLALTGPIGIVGQQIKRSCELWAKMKNASGGLLGQKIELVVEDTGGNPAACVRKTQQMVDRDGVRIITGIVFSSEALALAPKLKEWNTIFMSSSNGDGRLTADALVPNFFRPNTSGPMGARTVSLHLRQSKSNKIAALGLDYAWGHNSVQVFEEEMKRAKKNFVGKLFAPTGTKDYATYIAKLKDLDADAVFLVLQGDDNNAFLSQAKQFRLGEKMELLTEIVDLDSIRAVGDASLGLMGSSRYSFTYNHPKNKEFVALWQKEYNNVPDTFEGESWQTMAVLEAGILKAKSIDAEPLRAALETVELESVKGKLTMRKCDHQAVQQGFMVKVVKREGFSHPVPDVVAVYPGDVTTPRCNKTSYDD
ncbi:MAG: branched-chain amino acid ABC transporter substrate-binding protein [Betaproteobacteria bacterium]|nr:branched-chain amino acid ABC transporter substrate-binding protein [Betaproteobacteria bacterium]